LHYIVIINLIYL